MNITIYLGSWLVPAGITVLAIVCAVIFGAMDGKRGGDYSLPIFSLMASVAAFLVSITAWAVFIALKLLG